MCVGVPQCTHGGQKTALDRRFSSSMLWILRLELRVSAGQRAHLPHPHLVGLLLGILQQLCIKLSFSRHRQFSYLLGVIPDQLID